MSITTTDFHLTVDELRRQHDAIILAHNYQPTWVKQIADATGDSLWLSRLASESAASTIVFCGVEFMAESAKILSPEKKVFLPATGAGCSLSESIDAKALAKWQSEHPGAITVAYVITSAEVKALADVCCTSANAVEVVAQIPHDYEVLFLPDYFLGSYVAEKTGHPNLHLWMGECHVHAEISPDVFAQKIADHPDAEVFVHPECGCSTAALIEIAKNPKRLKMLSTNQMIEAARVSNASNILVATEIGILDELNAANPHIRFEPVNPRAKCPFMNKVTPELLIQSLKGTYGEIELDPDVIRAAQNSVRAMIDPNLRWWRS
jgi:quinolinate synthase